MDTSEAVKLLRSPGGVKRWNALPNDERLATSLAGANLSTAKLCGVDFNRANLCGADLELANLRNARLRIARLRRANLDSADLGGAQMIGADLTEANLNGADLVCCDLGSALLRGANLKDASLTGAVLVAARLSGASLEGAWLSLTNFANADLSGVNVSDAAFGGTVLGGNMLGLRGVENTRHVSASCVVEQLVSGLDEAAESLLRKCGLSEWEVLSLRLRDPSVTPAQFADLQSEIWQLRNSGPIFIGGVFISYAHDDSEFVDKLNEQLREDGATTWLDKHDLIAGDLQKQVFRAIRINDIVLLVLSESSVNSDWVEHELEMARDKEKREGRDVLCPIALDDSWKAKMNDVLWRQVKKKNVLDFSGKSGSFDTQFQKLVDGMKVNYSATPTG